jgi:HTH-type transcriptional regulator/antitoxin HigA
MEYRVIKSEKEYKEYSRRVFELFQKKPTKKVEDEIELLDLLINKWEQEHSHVKKMDPVQLLNHLMEVHAVNRDTLVKLLDVDKSTISLIINYKRGLSKSVIRKLSQFFKLSQEAFNRPYELKKDGSRGPKKVILKTKLSVKTSP